MHMIEILVNFNVGEVIMAKNEQIEKNEKNDYKNETYVEPFAPNRIYLM